jgi:hypothetical protein
MATPSTDLPREEVARRGTEIYNQLKPTIEPLHREKVIAIDVLSADYEIHPNLVTASQKLRERHPDAQVWFQRVGYDYLHSMISFRRES